MSLKTIDAICASSNEVGRKQIQFSSETGLIVRVASKIVDSKEVNYYFSDDCILFAGMGDIHIHAREDLSGKNNYKEDFSSACCAALNGGIVHVGDMPNNPIPPIDDHSYKEKFILSDKTQIPFLMYAGIGPSTRPLSLDLPYKAYMGPSIGELYFRSNDELESAISHYRNCAVSFHCEDPVVLENHKIEKDHFSRRPIKAELLATKFALHLIEKYQLRGKLCHYSAGEGLSDIIEAKKRGIDVSCEVTPQHLFFNETMIRNLPSEQRIEFQMNPPIRGIEDQKALLEGLRRGDIDFLATDHAPHSIEEKKKGISGLTGLDTFSCFVTWLLIEQRFTPQTIAKCCSENPGLFFNQFLPNFIRLNPHYSKWGKGFGFIEEGYSASFTVLNLHKPQRITANFLKTKAQSSPFLGMTFPGSLEQLFINGKIIEK